MPSVKPVTIDYEYRDGQIIATVTGDGPPIVMGKPATEAEWLEFQDELAKRGFDRLGRGFEPSSTRSSVGRAASS